MNGAETNKSLINADVYAFRGTVPVRRAGPMRDCPDGGKCIKSSCTGHVDISGHKGFAVCIEIVNDSHGEVLNVVPVGLDMIKKDPAIKEGKLVPANVYEYVSEVQVEKIGTMMSCHTGTCTKNIQAAISGREFVRCDGFRNGNSGSFSGCRNTFVQGRGKTNVTPVDSYLIKMSIPE